MSVKANTTFTTEEVLHQAQLNLNFSLLGAIAYLKKHQQSPEDWSSWLGQQAAPGWEWFRGQGVNEFTRMAALNLVSFGAELISLSGDETRSELVVAGWPPTETLELLHLAQSDADLVMLGFKQIAEFLELKIQWQREGNSVKLTVSR